MRKKPLTQISFAFEDLGAAPDEKNEQLLDQAPAEVQSVETVVPPSTPSPSIGVRSIRKKEEKSPVGKRGRKSMREMANRANQIQVPPDEELFKKQYYTIGEVAKMFQENQSLIRYWESEFDILQPKKNKKGDRYFRPVDVKNLVLIYDLLRRRKFTIEGARDFLKKNKKAEDKFTLIQSLQQLRSFLIEIRSNLQKP
ncbi:MAG: MerR family transcriptional regulator [Chitinophagaceae bacterium]|nr:MerR family transcriptional regulator [Chitinophagaceae bacterium]